MRTSGNSDGNEDYWDIFLDYNCEVSSGETNRAEEMLKSYGDIEKGKKI